MIVANHTAGTSDSDLRDLWRMLTEMGALAERHVARSVQALVTADEVTAREVVEEDAAFDAIRKTIEERVVQRIVRRNTVAVNLREMFSFLRIAGELERIGELARNIAHHMLTICAEELTRAQTLGLKHMADAMAAQLRHVLDSFARRDVAMAVDVWTHDEDVDRRYAELCRELVGRMTENPAAVTSAIHLLFCAKNLERMGDHATNIAEAVYYMVEGHRISGERPKRDVTSMRRQ